MGLPRNRTWPTLTQIARSTLVLEDVAPHGFHELSLTVSWIDVAILLVIVFLP